MGSARPGGAEQFFDRLVVALAARGLDQAVAIRRLDERRRWFEQHAVPCNELPMVSVHDGWSRYRLRRIAERLPAAMTLSWMSRAAALAPKAFGGRLAAARLGGYYKLKYFRNVDIMLANTKALCDYIIDGGWPREKVHYLPNFVDATKAEPLPRAQFGFRDDQTVLLALGRLHADKGFDLLLAALAELDHNTVLLLGGVGPLERALKDQARALGLSDRVRFLGWRRDVAALFATADLFVCSSRLEPLGNIVIEAFAHGVPVVAVDSPGPRELINPGKNGVVTPAEDARALAGAIRRVTSDPGFAEDLQSAGMETYTSKFTEAVVCDAYLNLFNDLVGVS